MMEDRESTGGAAVGRGVTGKRVGVGLSIGMGCRLQAMVARERAAATATRGDFFIGGYQSFAR